MLLNDLPNVFTGEEVIRYQSVALKMSLDLTGIVINQHFHFHHFALKLNRQRLRLVRDGALHWHFVDPSLGN